MRDSLMGITERIIGAKYRLSRSQALELYQDSDIYDLMYAAHKVTRHYHGNRVHLCSIVNAKSGRCTEDCAFCAQASRHQTHAPSYPLLSSEQISSYANEAASHQAERFGVVTSGATVSDDELTEIITAMQAMNGILPCASLGNLSAAQITRLAAAGVTRLHHNLETSRAFFPKICTTHQYQERVDTIKRIKASGLKVCAGGIFGVGETPADRIDLAFTLLELDVDAVPLNFLAAIPGTPLAGQAALPPLNILRIIAIYRLVLFDKEIKIGGGRVTNLRSLQSWIFYAGANGALVGNYLTTAGNPVATDLEMLADLELDPIRCHHG